jgi:hypothetical protein
MTPAESLYRAALLAWLQARRDRPQDNSPEPKMPEASVTNVSPGWHRWTDYRAIRAEVIRDWERKE